MNALVEKRNELEEKNKVLAKVFKEAGAEMDLEKVESLEGTTREKAAKVKEMNDELTDLGKEVEELFEVEKAEKATKAREELMAKGKEIILPGGDGAASGPQGPVKSIGQMFVESPAYLERHARKEAVLEMEVKALFETTAGWAPESIRTGRIVEIATRPIQITDLIPAGQTGQNSIKYMEETTMTNAAAEVAQGGAYAEAALVLTEKSSPVEKVGVLLPITDEQLEDVAQASSYVDNRLRFMLQQRVDSQILVGDGVSPNLKGILNVSGIQTQAKGADPVPDAIYKAMTLVRVTGRAQPNAVILHPNDWQGVRLLRTADGLYIWGSPSETGPERIWGRSVIQSDAITENTGLVGDYQNFIELVARRGIEVKVSDSHSDFFSKGKKAIRADVRVALPTYRPAAFCTVTGI
ncbi:MAG: phage major capsid protein [Candidatus Brocadiales bacterium]|nr:phage major capsid protein [Candidatus Bathyanammoxibius amoris]